MALLRATYAQPSEFLAAIDAEISRHGLLVRGASLEPGAVAGSGCTVRVEVADEAPIDVSAQIAAAVPGVGVAVLFPSSPQPLLALAQKLRTSPEVPGAPVAPAPPGGDDGARRAGDAEAPSAADEAPDEPEPAESPRPPPGSLSERLRALSVAEKTRLALSGSREERMALLRDPAKPVHVFVLKNPRIGLDEIQYAAKQASLSPDALKLIADHRDWGQNPGVCSALVRNPKVPVPLALRLLDRVPTSEVKAIAKGGARDQVVQAARKRAASQGRGDR
jgi:hypothetical protein